MSWLTESLKGVLGNAIYDAIKTWGFPLITAYALPAAYGWLAKVGYVHWNWQIIAGLIFIAVIINAFAVYKLVKDRPIRIPASTLTSLQNRRSELLEKQEIETVDKNLGAIRRRVEEVQDTVNGNSRVVNILSHLDVATTREVADAMDCGPKTIMEIETELITEANRIERNMKWPEFRKIGNAVAEVNRTIVNYNLTPNAALSERLSRELEQVRKHVVVIDRQFFERFGQIPDSANAA